MKKTYTKPEILFESFSFSNSIAAGCEIVIDNQSRGNCGYAYEGSNGSTMFTMEIGAPVCTITTVDDEKNTFCYHVPIESNNIFNS